MRPTRNCKDELHGRTPLQEHRGARVNERVCVNERVRVCRKGMREGENVCVLSLIRKFNWMEFGSFFSAPLFRAGCNKQTFLFPFHPSVVCSSASARLALSLLTAIPIRKPEPGGKWRDCIDTADHCAPHNWQLFLSFTSGDELNRLCKIWWLPKKERGVGKERGTSYHHTALALWLPGTQGSVGKTSSTQEAKVKNSWK